jgi:hypothetical protein
MVQERFGSQKSFVRNGVRAVPIPARFPAVEEGVLQLTDGMCLKSFCVLKGLQDFFERLGKPRGLITGRPLGTSKLSAEYRKFTAVLPSTFLRPFR